LSLPTFFGLGDFLSLALKGPWRLAGGATTGHRTTHFRTPAGVPELAQESTNECYWHLVPRPSRGAANNDGLPGGSTTG